MLFAMRVTGKLPEEISFEFNLKSKADTARLAQAFAKVVSPDLGLERSITLGLSGETGSGKTHFCRSFFDALGVNISVETLNRDVVRKRVGDVAVEHADLLDNPEYTPKGSSAALVNIFALEHYEQSDFMPDISVEFTKGSGGQREVTLTCDDDLADQPEFRQFLQDAADLRV